MAHPSEYGELIDQLLSEAAKICQPANGMFELTSRCNLNCRMCYVRRPVEDARAQSAEISPEQWIVIAEAAVARGMLFLCLTGGEPLIRPDFFEIYESLRSMGVIITLFTNGTLVTDEVARRLARHPPNKVEVSLYGATEATYQAVTGVPGSFDRCISGIEKLLSYNIRLVLKSTLSSSNVHELEAMRDMANAMGLHFSFDPLLSKRRDGRSSGASCLRISASECIDLEAMDPVSVRAWCSVEKRTDDPEGAGDFYCMAGKNAFVIGPSGTMNICVDLPVPAARTLEIGFGEAWSQVQHFVASSPVASKCKACEIKAYCGRCPAWSYTETGTLTEPVQYLCEIARERHRRYAG